VAREVKAAVEAVKGTQARLFINDHWQAALDAGAYGIHVGQEDLDVIGQRDLQTIRSSGTRLGVSTHGYAEMVRAHAVQPSYIALGAVFPPRSRRWRRPAGLARLAAYVRLMQQYPLVAIGGISEDLFPAVRATGVGSVAVVRALVNAPDPEAAASICCAHASCCVNPRTTNSIAGTLIDKSCQLFSLKATDPSRLKNSAHENRK
jgi:thiamine-phosphate pyrophosphorylase